MPALTLVGTLDGLTLSYVYVHVAQFGVPALTLVGTLDGLTLSYVYR